MLYLIRHGETEWSKSGQHTGRTDLPLTERGQEEALSLKNYPFPVFNHVFTSPLKRAKETCRLAGYLEKATLADALYEWNYGDYEGLTSPEIEKLHPGWNVFIHGAPGGESIEEVTLRCKQFLDSLQSLKGPIALFSSGHILRALTAIYLNQPLAFGRQIMLKTATISILSHDHGVPAILQWNLHS